MATYYALTTTNPQTGWEVIGIAPTREAAEAMEPALTEGSDIYAQTRFRNFRVMSKTAAIRGGYIPRRGEWEW